MSSDAFNIRLSVLSMAKDLLVEEFHSKREEIHENWVAQRDSSEDYTPIDTLKYPGFPTAKEILDKANHLYSFVTNRG